MTTTQANRPYVALSIFQALFRSEAEAVRSDVLRERYLQLAADAEAAKGAITRAISVLRDADCRCRPKNASSPVRTCLRCQALASFGETP